MEINLNDAKTLTNDANDAMIHNQISSNTFFAANADEKFSFNKNLLIGTVQMLYMEKKTFKFISLCTIGFLVESYMVLIPNSKFEEEIIKNPTLVIKFIPSDRRFKNDFVRGYSILVKEDEDIIGIINRKTSKTNEIEDLSLKNWSVIVLENPVGELMLEMTLQLDNFYFDIEKNFDTKINTGIYFSFISKSHDQENQITTHLLDNKVLRIDRKNILIVFPDFPDSEIESVDAILYLKTYGIIGVFEGKRNKLMHYTEAKMFIEDKKDEILINKFNYLSKKNSYSNDLAFALIQIFTVADWDDLKFTIEELKKEYYKYKGIFNFNYSSYDTLEHNLDYYKMHTLFVAPDVLIDRIAASFKIETKSLDKHLMVKRLIHANLQKYNIRSLDLKGYHIETYNLKTLMDSFHNINNIQFFDFSRTRINFERAKILADFLYSNKSLKQLILRNVQMGPAGLFIVIQAIKYSQNKYFTSFNISDNEFSHLFDDLCVTDKEDLKYLQLPSVEDLSFISMIFEIPTLKEIYMMNINIRSNKFGKIMKSVVDEMIKEKQFNSSNLTGNIDNLSLNNPSSKRMCRLRKINLSKNNLKDNFNIFVKYLELSKDIEEIYLSSCYLYDDDVKSFIDFLFEKQKENPLKVLDLSNNNITWKFAGYIRKCSSNFNLYLNESGSQYSIDKIQKEELEEKNNNEKVELSINLSNNTNIKSDGLADILASFDKFPFPVNLYFDNIGGLNESAFDAIENSLRINRPIKKISLAFNNITDDLILGSNINKILEYSPLMTLDLHGNDISIESVYHLIKDFSRPKKGFRIICDRFNYKKIQSESKSLKQERKNSFASKIKIEDDPKKYEICFRYLEFYKK